MWGEVKMATDSQTAGGQDSRWTWAIVTLSMLRRWRLEKTDGGGQNDFIPWDTDSNEPDFAQQASSIIKLVNCPCRFLFAREIHPEGHASIYLHLGHVGRCDAMWLFSGHGIWLHVWHPLHMCILLWFAVVYIWETPPRTLQSFWLNIMLRVCPGIGLATLRLVRTARGRDRLRWRSGFILRARD